METHRRVNLRLPLGMAILALFAWNGAATARGCPEDNPRVIRIEITIDYEAGTVSIEEDQKSVTVYLTGWNRARRVCWAADDLRADHTLHFDDKDADGEKGFFPQMDRAMRKPPGFINSGNAAKMGTWRYGITVKDSDGKEIATLDPEVIIKGG